MFTIVPWIFFLIITLAASCMRKNGARTFTSNIESNSSGLVSRIVPRSVMAAALTSTSTRPNAFSAAGITFRAAARSSRSAATKTVLQPPFEMSSATALPRFLLRPTMTRPAAPRSAKSRAIASPSPCVPPVTTAILPLSCFFIFGLRSLRRFPAKARRRFGRSQSAANLENQYGRWQDDAPETHPRRRYRHRRRRGDHARRAASGARSRRLHDRQRQCRGRALHRQHAARARSYRTQRHSGATRASRARSSAPIFRSRDRSTTAPENSTARRCRSRAPKSTKAATGAVEFLIETYRNATDEIVLVPVAPLTNIAAALALYPKLVERVPEVVDHGRRPRDRQRDAVGGVQRLGRSGGGRDRLLRRVPQAHAGAARRDASRARLARRLRQRSARSARPPDRRRPI